MRLTILSVLSALVVALAQPALAQSPYTIGGVTAPPGTTVSGELQIPRRRRRRGRSSRSRS